MRDAPPAEAKERLSVGTHGPEGYHKARDRRNRPIRGLWVRNGRYYARLAVPDPKGGKVRTRRIPLEGAQTAAQAVEQLNALKLARKQNDMPITTRTPRIESLVEEYIKTPTGKKKGTRDKERYNLQMWSRHIGSIRVDRLTASDILRVREARLRQGISNRTANLDIIALRQLLKWAKLHGHLRSLPTDEISALLTETKKRPLPTAREIAALCRAARRVSRNGRQFADYVLLMAYSGCRRNEALRIRWMHVSFAHRHLIIFKKTKNSKSRDIPLHPKLERLLRRMHRSRAPDSVWLFPSPQRGRNDRRTKSFEATFKAALAASGILEGRGLPPRAKRASRKGGKDLPAADLVRQPSAPPSPEPAFDADMDDDEASDDDEGFHLHDLRHYFISHCVMSGIDFMTIADWVGHQDGGRLIGQVYGHLADGHSRRQATRVSFAH